MKLIGKRKGTLWHPQGWDVEPYVFNREPLILATKFRLMTTTDNLLFQIYSGSPAQDHPVASVAMLHNQNTSRIAASARNACR